MTFALSLPHLVSPLFSFLVRLCVCVCVFCVCLFAFLDEDPVECGGGRPLLCNQWQRARLPRLPSASATFHIHSSPPRRPVSPPATRQGVWRVTTRCVNVYPRRAAVTQTGKWARFGMRVCVGERAEG